MSGGKLGKLLRLLASDKDGEVVAAARAITRTLRAEGQDIHALADVVERIPLAPQKETRSPPDKPSDWRTMRSFCLKHQNQLSTRELEFITSLGRWRGKLTPKQSDWLQAIYERITD